MGAGFTWMDSSLKRCGRERIGRDEEGTSSGIAVLGGYTAILKRNPDTQDLLTATDSEVLCRLVRRWIGQGGMFGCRVLIQAALGVCCHVCCWVRLDNLQVWVPSAPWVPCVCGCVLLMNRVSDCARETGRESDCGCHGVPAVP
jgi:hypothetical protein